MTTDTYKEKAELACIVLIGISVILGISVFVEVTGYYIASAGAEGFVNEALTQGSSNPEQIEDIMAQSRSIADNLKKKNLFAPPPPKQHPVREVPAILGSAALINGKWYKVGESVADAKIVAIDAYSVSIEWDGSVKIFAPIGPLSSPTSGERKPQNARPTDRGRSGARVVVVGERSSRGRRGSGRLSPEERARLRERWQNMSEEERRQLRQEMRERRGAGRGD
jgi:hypothetical protein